MRSWLPVLALLALGCSARYTGPSTPPEDAATGPDGASLCIPGAQVACACVGGASGAQVCAADGRALGPCTCPMADAAVTVDRPAPRDAPDVLMARDVVDAGCAVGESEPCACPGTLGERRCAADGWSACRCPSLDAGAPPDAGEAPDVAVAVPDVVDAPPVDAGPQVYPLDPPPGGLDVRVLFARTCASLDGGRCDDTSQDTAMGATCARTGDRLNFTLRACSPFGTCATLTGLVPSYRSAAGASVSVVWGNATQGRDIEVVAGPAGARQSFRVSFSAPPTPNAQGVTGVPGRTVSPERGDVWLLGCEVR